MRIRQQILQEPTAVPVPGQSVRLRRESDNVTLDIKTTDVFGLVDFVYDGHPGLCYLHVQGAPGGEKYWASEDAGGAGPLVLRDIPPALSALGNGVIAGLEEELAVTASGSSSIAIAQGFALVGGIPVSNYIADVLPLTRPTTATRIDRLSVCSYTSDDPTFPGQSGIVLTTGTEGGAAPASSATATKHETTLALITVPVAAAITVKDARSFAGGAASDVTGTVRDSNASTSSATGELLGDLTLTLDLPLPVTYDIVADATAEQVQEDVAGGWTLDATYGSAGTGTAPNFMTPGQVAVAPSGVVYVADTANNRVVAISAAGTHIAARTGLSQPEGVAVDASGGIYVSDRQGLRKYATAADFAAGTAAWTTNASLLQSLGHLSTDGATVYAISTTLIVFRAVAAYLTSTGALITPSLISGLTAPRGILTTGAALYVSEGGSADRISMYTVAGTLVTRWGSTGVATGKFNEPRGLAVDAAGNIWVADYRNDRMQRFSSTGAYQDTIAQVDPAGVAVASNAALWVSNAGSSNLARWVAAGAITAGYGEVALEIDGVASAYVGIGNREGWVTNSAEGAKAGAGTVTVRVLGSATYAALVVEQATLIARAIPRR